MKVIVVANPKGGVGKSTLSTNLAGYFAARGESVMLGDVDRQQSAHDWLSVRSPALPKIDSWEVQADQPARPPKGTRNVVLDTPAGIHGKLLDRVLKEATHIVVPLQPSLFDILATQHFLATLRDIKAVRKGELKVGIVGMRVDLRTRSAHELERFLAGYDLPVLGLVRDSQRYVQLAARGMTLFDLSEAAQQRDIGEWQGLFDWFRTTPRSAALD